jgi:hypothetical protein
MAIFKAIVNSDYVQIPNKAMQDSLLTFEARGLLAMLLSMPSDWEVHKSWVAKESPAGKDKVNSMFNELERAGYIRREEGQRKYGQFASDDYFVFPNKSTIADLPLRSSRCGSTVDGESATIKETVKQNKQEENKQVSIVHKRISKPEIWKEFYRSYPETRRGGSDATAWNKAKAMKLNDNDFQLMLDDVVNRKAFHSGWANPQYIQGITKYISEKLWLTPIEQASQSTDFSGQQSVSNWADGLANEFHGVNK